jgi:murein DD-endopeptidase MepM/ murein hydrolase activator NlpD
VGKIKRVSLVVVALLLVVATSGCSRKEDRTPAAGAPLGESGAPDTAGTSGADPATEEGSVAAGLQDVGAMPAPESRPQSYVVQAGDTLSSIAVRFDCTVQDLIQANQLANPNLLSVGQQIEIPSTSTEVGPDLQLLPNSEFVNGPAYVSFDTGAFCARQGGYLVDYQENVGGTILSGPEIVNLVAHHYSLGPRLLLAVIEQASGWLTNPTPSGAAVQAPLGNRGGGWGSFHVQLAWAADKLSEGYYDWRGRGMNLKLWSDGTATRYAPTLNAATAGLQYFYSLNSTKEQWRTLIGEGPGSFAETYRRLFGDPAQYAIEPLIRADTEVPTLTLPWSNSELWFYTGGPHGGWNDGSGWAAIDVVPDEGYLGCQAASSWATAAAPGLVIFSQDGEVLIDLDQDGHEETGWVLFYLHVASQGRVPVGTTVRHGDHIGHPSCEGGFSESTHLHFARRYNGEWIAADGPLPLVLSGWQFYSSGSPYDGTASRDDQERTACECRNPELNGLVADR